jgi:transposase
VNSRRTGPVPLRDFLRQKLKECGVREVNVPPNGFSCCPRCSVWNKRPMADPVTGVVVSCEECEELGL